MLVAGWDAERAVAETGLRPGDVICALNGAPVATPTDLNAGLARLAADDPVVLHVDRPGEMRFVAFERE